MRQHVCLVQQQYRCTVELCPQHAVSDSKTCCSTFLVQSIRYLVRL